MWTMDINKIYKKIYESTQVWAFWLKKQRKKLYQNKHTFLWWNYIYLLNLCLCYTLDKQHSIKVKLDHFENDTSSTSGMFFGIKYLF